MAVVNRRLPRTTKRRRSEEDLRAALTCYEIALRNSNVTVFTQDRDLRYGSISNPFLGLEIDEIVGRSDADIIPAENLPAVLAIKRNALDNGLPADAELQIRDGPIVRWFDFHIEPLRDPTGTVIGLACAAVDVTDRKEHEKHLRLVMRELTHRSKNLLAVVQALARQTARYASSTDSYIERFSARLQALARSHDLLVQADWQSAALGDLVKSHLGAHLGQQAAQISMEGPSLRLKPEAAQTFGLALHELAANASRYGALSQPHGRLAIAWALRPASNGGGVEFTWSEEGGPRKGVPKRRGFGTHVIQANLARSLEADVELDFTEDGLRCRIAIPHKHVLAVESSEGGEA
jgi:PAS domain S-box-containing protein